MWLAPERGLKFGRNRGWVAVVVAAGLGLGAFVGVSPAAAVVQFGLVLSK